jgi:hypothetical protein
MIHLASREIDCIVNFLTDYPMVVASSGGRVRSVGRWKSMLLAVSLSLSLSLSLSAVSAAPKEFLSICAKIVFVFVRRRCSRRLPLPDSHAITTSSRKGKKKTTERETKKGNKTSNISFFACRHGRKNALFPFCRQREGQFRHLRVHRKYTKLRRQLTQVFCYPSLLFTKLRCHHLVLFLSQFPSPSSSIRHLTAPGVKKRTRKHIYFNEQFQARLLLDKTNTV